ncbi:MAG: hypothetical protein ACOCUH_01235 [Bacteriovoracia bacterium]
MREKIIYDYFHEIRGDLSALYNGVDMLKDQCLDREIEEELLRMLDDRFEKIGKLWKDFYPRVKEQI